ncbi:LysM peptidoglycan-binding domain-containing protein [Bacillus suaedaesalsae]|uniref:LysM peptidoglycan-binding domain-containing protein n=1 Tax=Bacillus suaedaesalsae TaxID=2810349 RepID=A0ABS2DM05_9BACI|nr:LysM peptidoglycan-binding domain-containing protein [Bacillus suaedaesalsae]MBM6619521.1 LysM peptidoglycan-binding domain-containing protein [Bacillus suaedaesalsae]
MLRSSRQYFYTVRAGDTVSGMSSRFGVPIQAIIAANNLVLPYTLYIGQQLAIPLGYNRYRVIAGDSIYKIGEKFGVPISAIIEANQLVPPFMIYPEQVLLIPPGVPYYVVQRGDSLYGIANRFNVKTNGVPNYELIRSVNQLNSYTIFPGMRLVIPFAVTGEQGILAYISDRNGSFDLWLYELQTGTHTKMTTGLAASFSIPFWSPNNDKIAFVGKNQILYVIDVRQNTVATIDQLNVNGVHFIGWSSDSQKLAYSKQNTLVLYTLSSHTVKTVQINGVTDVMWFPNGTEILFQGTAENGLSQLYKMNVETMQRTKLTNNDDNPKNNVRLSPDGSYALYTTPGASISLIRTVNLLSGEIDQVKGGTLAKNYYPSWSPNSENISYSATAFSSGYYSEVRTVNRNGRNDRTVAISTCFATPITWSPDSGELIYLSGCTEEQFAKDAWFVNLLHPVPIHLFGGFNVVSISWSNNNRTGNSLFRSEEYRVQFLFPSHWRKQNEERYEGIDGFFQVSAIAGSSNIEDICQNEAHHSLNPYGTQPQIRKTTIEGEEACFIFPSDDQLPEMKNQAALIVRYPEPITIQGEVYQYFILWSDQNHIEDIAFSLSFI